MSGTGVGGATRRSTLLRSTHDLVPTLEIRGKD